MALRNPQGWWNSTRRLTAITLATCLAICAAALAATASDERAGFAAMPADLFAITIALPVVLAALAIWHVGRQNSLDMRNRVSERD